MAHIGLNGAGRASPIRDKRTGHRPLSNPAAPSEAQLPQITYVGPKPARSSRRQVSMRHVVAVRAGRRRAVGQVSACEGGAAHKNYSRGAGHARYMPDRPVTGHDN